MIVLRALTWPVRYAAGWVGFVLGMAYLLGEELPYLLRRGRGR